MLVRRALPVLTVLAAVAIAGCGSSGGGTLNVPAVGAARTFNLSDFTPKGSVEPGKPVSVSFDIRQPSGAVLTRFKRGAGPHTGIHLIIVRTDLGAIIHRHPPVLPSGHFQQTVTFPTGGTWHVLIDVYPNLPGSQPNFQLVDTIHVKGAYKHVPIGTFHPTDHVDGFDITIHDPPKIKALTPAFLNVTVARPDGTKANFTPWYGALAHAIFFQVGTLNYFHTHVCTAQTAGCTSALGGAKVTGVSTTPGKLSVGVLLPVPGTWKLFLQTKVNGTIMTAPFTFDATA
jgi:hypothetical protein